MQLSKYSKKIQALLLLAQSVAKKENHSAVEAEHLLKALLESSALKSYLKSAPKAFSARLKMSLLAMPSAVNAKTYLSKKLVQLLDMALLRALERGKKATEIEDVLAALLEKDSGENEWAPFINFDKELKSGFLPELHSAPDGAIAKYTQNLSLLAFQGRLDPLVGRQDALKKLVQVLSRKTRNSALLIGDPGVGKNAILKGFAQILNTNKAPTGLRSKVLLNLNLSAMMAGATLRGQFEERVKSLLSEMSESSSEFILCIDEIHNIAGDGSNASGALSLIKPALVNGELQLLGATTLGAYRNSIESDLSLDRQFQTILVDEPSEDECLNILKGIKKGFEDFHQVKLQNDALESAVKMSARYLLGKKMPQKAVDLLDEASARFKLETGSKSAKVGASDIAAIVSEITGIPLHKMLENEQKKLLNLESILGESVKGQAEALAGVSRAIIRSRAGLSDPNKPIGSFLFMGPSGVGKTLLAKTLTRFLFDSDKALVRFDMSEFMEKHTVSRLIGAPPGYAGSQAGGQLSEAVRRRPYSVILFDEVEKAHPDVINILLQILDEGRLSDSKGRLVNFKNTVIILTSNLGAHFLLSGQNSEGTLDAESKNMAKETLFAHFRPEFINRLDEIIFFHALTRDNLENILALEVVSLNKMLLDKGMRLELDSSVSNFLLAGNSKAAFGARPIKRALQRLVQDPLAREILEGKLKGCKKILVSLKKETGKTEVVFNPA